MNYIKTIRVHTPLFRVGRHFLQFHEHSAGYVLRLVLQTQSRSGHSRVKFLLDPRDGKNGINLYQTVEITQGQEWYASTPDHPQRHGAFIVGVFVRLRRHRAARRYEPVSSRPGGRSKCRGGSRCNGWQCRRCRSGHGPRCGGWPGGTVRSRISYGTSLADGDDFRWPDHPGALRRAGG